MLFDHIGSGFAACRHSKTGRSVFAFDLDHQRAQNIDAKAFAALAIFRITAHRRGDMVVDPMAFALVVIVGATAAFAALDDRRADLLDFAGLDFRRVRHNLTIWDSMIRCPDGLG